MSFTNNKTSDFHEARNKLNKYNNKTQKISKRLCLNIEFILKRRAILVEDEDLKVKYSTVVQNRHQ